MDRPCPHVDTKKPTGFPFLGFFLAYAEKLEEFFFSCLEIRIPLFFTPPRTANAVEGSSVEGSVCVWLFRAVPSFPRFPREGNQSGRQRRTDLFVGQSRGLEAHACFCRSTQQCCHRSIPSVQPGTYSVLSKAAPTLYHWGATCPRRKTC